MVQRISWKVRLGDTPRFLHRCVWTSGLFSVVLMRLVLVLVLVSGGWKGMMVLPSGIKVFWPLMTCTPRLNMFGNDKADSLIYLNTLKIVCFGIKRGEQQCLVIVHLQPI